MNAKLAKELTKKTQESQDVDFMKVTLEEVKMQAERGYNRALVIVLERQVKLLSKVRKLGFNVSKFEHGSDSYVVSWENA